MSEIGERKQKHGRTWKEKISATTIMNRLVKCVEGTVEMTPSQVRAADIILRKIVPDLARNEVTGVDQGPVELVVKWRSEK